MQYDDNNRPHLVIWETTQAGAKAQRNGRAAVNPNRHPLELNGSEVRAMIDQVARLQPESLMLTGNDPMARPDLVELIAHATKQGLRVTMCSSATPRLASADFQTLMDAGLQQISLSLDRAAEVTLPGVESDGDYTMTAVRKARQAGLPLQVHTTFTRANIGQFDALVATMDEIQPRRWSVFQAVHGAMDGVEPLTAIEREELSRKLVQLAQHVPYEIKTTESQGHGQAKPSQDLIPREKQVASGIVEGRGFLFISHVGGLRPSNFHPITAGNVRVCDLLEVYRRCGEFQRHQTVSRSSDRSAQPRGTSAIHTDGLTNKRTVQLLQLAPA